MVLRTPAQLCAHPTRRKTGTDPSTGTMSEAECIFLGNPQACSDGSMIGPFLACTYAGVHSAGQWKGRHRLRFKRAGVGVVCIQERSSFFAVQHGPTKLPSGVDHGDPVYWSAAGSNTTDGHHVATGAVGFVMRRDPNNPAQVVVWWSNPGFAMRCQCSKLGYVKQRGSVTAIVSPPPTVLTESARYNHGYILAFSGLQGARCYATLNPDPQCRCPLCKLCLRAVSEPHCLSSARVKSQLGFIEKDPRMGDETARFVAKAARRLDGHNMTAANSEHQVMTGPPPNKRQTIFRNV